MKDPAKVKQGKRNKAMGADFERRTRNDMENDGFVVAKWTNNVKNNECVPARPGKFRMMQTGFPDFVAYRVSSCICCNYNVIFVECKVNGILSKEEKAKAKWYLERGYCKKFFIAYKTKDKNRVKVNYKEFK